MPTLSASTPGWDQMASALLAGSVALLVLGLQPILLGELVAQQAATMEGVGMIAMGEIMALGIGVALSDSMAPLRHYRRIAMLAAIAAALLDAATCRVSGDAPLLTVRALAGVAEGILVWVATGMIVRGSKPDRLAASFVVTQTLTQAGAAAVLALLVIPRWGWQGGFLALAAMALAALPLMPGLPSSLAPLTVSNTAPLRWQGAALAPLAITFAMMAAIGALWAYLEPLGLSNGLKAAEAQTVVSLSLGFQVLGGVTAVMTVHRVHAAATLAGGAVALALLATAMHFLPWGSVTLFAILSAAFGYCWLFLMPFQVAQALVADPRGRIATLVPAAQLVGSAFGPMLASCIIDGDQAGAVPFVSAGFAVLALCLALPGLRSGAGWHLRQAKP
ncbi:putative MFS family arabinose efflux permease [Duganella sp. SG902]|uniref:MFS transporter n=1 Tax=Duganella sp. SG902 TaxID=2587016 RepID=UPI0017A842AD|nr:MFS transporter [Duganella sp. SG902]NVM77527.1 putative MFS family arabinose efflux permease [Duganella sp. SG902]